MKTEAERRNEYLIRGVIDNTDFFESWGLKDIEIPKFDFLETESKSARRRPKRVNSRILQVAGFVIAVLFVSVVMTVATNSELVTAGKFQIDIFMFSAKNGFLTSDFHLITTTIGKELLIEKEDQISIGKGFLKELKIPGYIPDGYIFNKLQITNNYKNEYTVTYVYKNITDDIIMIKQNAIADYNQDIAMVDIDDSFYIGDARIFSSSSVMSDYKTIVAFTKSEIICINGKLALDELKDIFIKYE